MCCQDRGLVQPWRACQTEERLPAGSARPGAERPLADAPIGPAQGIESRPNDSHIRYRDMQGLQPLDQDQEGSRLHVRTRFQFAAHPVPSGQDTQQAWDQAAGGAVAGSA